MASLQQNEILIKEQNKMLEIKVDERTRALKHTLSELEISQQQLEQKISTLLTKKKEVKIYCSIFCLMK